MTSSRRCRDCPRLIPATAPRGRCHDCNRAADKARGKRAHGSGSDWAHTALRRSYQQRMDASECFTCWRCWPPIDPAHWHLGHDDVDRSRYRGPECPPCNLSAAGRLSGGGGYPLDTPS